jgi:hypothetical protein
VVYEISKLRQKHHDTRSRGTFLPRSFYLDRAIANKKSEFVIRKSWFPHLTRFFRLSQVTCLSKRRSAIVGGHRNAPSHHSLKTASEKTCKKKEEKKNDMNIKKEVRAGLEKPPQMDTVTPSTSFALPTLGTRTRRKR